MKEEQVFDQVNTVFDRLAFPEAIMPDIRGHLAGANDAKKEFRDLEKTIRAIPRKE